MGPGFRRDDGLAMTTSPRGFATTGFAAVDMSGGGNTLRFAMP